MALGGVPDALLQALQRLPFVEALYLFGSRARGTHQPRADVDLAVWCPKATPAEWLHLLDAVEEAHTLLLIDCVRLDLEAPDSPLRANIEREKVVLFERKLSA